MSDAILWYKESGLLGEITNYRTRGGNVHDDFRVFADAMKCSKNK